MFVGLAILGPAGPAPGSLEGFVYTRLRIRDQLWGLPEVCLQTLLFSVLVNAWYRYPSRWWNRAMAGALVMITVMCTLGVLAALYPEAFQRKASPHAACTGALTRATTVAEEAPPPSSGGTLLAAQDGKLLIAAARLARHP
jgi:hypothetical protein